MRNQFKKLTIRSSKFILGNSLEELKYLETDSVDMIFCDPPYFLQLTKELRRPDMSVVKGVKKKHGISSLLIKNMMSLLTYG